MKLKQKQAERERRHQLYEAVIRFANDMDRDWWRRHVTDMHSAHWPWNQKAENENSPAMGQ